MKTTVLKTNIAIALIFKSLGAVAITRYVNNARPDNSGNGQSWATAYKDLQNAFHFDTDMKIYGGFAGTETLLSQLNWNTNLTVLLETSVTIM